MNIVWRDDDESKHPMRMGYIRVEFETWGRREGTAYIGAEHVKAIDGRVALGSMVEAIEAHIGAALRSARQL